MNKIKDTKIDYKSIIENYIDIKDWRTSENATVSYSIGGLILSNSGAVTANYWLSEIYDKEIENAHRNADIHIHDLSMLAPYCAGWSLKQLIQEGLGGIPGKITSSPANHLSTLCNQMVNFLGIMQNEWAGAQAFSSFDTYLAPFIKVDNLSYKEVKQCIQSFVYGINTPSRWGTQAPFTNITLDWTVPNDLSELNVIVGGKELNFRYKDCKAEMDMINKAFIEIMIEGDANGRGFQYPIPTYSITKDFDWSDTENNKLLFEMTAKYGTPYFSNYINSDMAPEDVRSMCVVPDTQVRIRVNGKCIICSIEEMYDNYSVDEIEILTKNGYKPVQEKMRFEYTGKLYKFITKSGKELITTPDHPHIVLRATNNNTYQYDKICALEVKVGDSFTCFHRQVQNNPIYDEQSNLQKVNTSISSKGHYILKENNIQYINDTDEIEKIELIDYTGYVYDVEVDTSNLSKFASIKYAHAFYANDILTGNCCRLRLDLRDLRKKTGGFFGSGESTGSVGVVTINMPRIAYISNSKEEFYSRLTNMMDISARSLYIKRKTLTDLLDRGLYPYTKHYLGTFNNHFSTIGLIGMNEACLNANWINKDLSESAAQDFTVEVLNFMREKLSDYQEQYGDLYNLEATPAESTTYRLAKHDKEKYPDIITAAEDSETPYYTNSSHLPVDYTDDIFSALDIQDKFQTLYTSGTVFHAFLGEKLPTWKSACALVKKIAENYKLPYYTLSPTYSICSSHGYIKGEETICPKCGKKTEIYSRITGYYRPVQNWNEGKLQEYKQRETYKIITKELYDKSDIIQIHEEDVTRKNLDITESYLFATPTCPNCKIAAVILEKAKYKYTKVIVDESTRDLVNEYGIVQAPTLVVKTNDKIQKFSGVSNIKKFLNV